MLRSPRCPVKIGIVADIHADPQALRRVLVDMPSVDRVLCAGDAVSEYQFCAETVQLLQQVKAQCIQGNHEMVLFHGSNAAYLKKCQAEFAPALLDVLATAPVSLDLEVTGARLLMVHASPWKPFEDYIFPRSPKLPRFAQLPYDFVILGHTHVPMVEHVDRVTVINPGSCAQPRDQDRRGSYAILDLECREVKLRRVRLD
jgi:putative phosphoesterase